MKRYFFSISMVLFLNLISGLAVGQNFPVLTNPHLSYTDNGKIDANGLAENQQVRFHITIMNLDAKQTVAAGSCELLIDLGNKLILSSEAGLPYTDYFTWTLSKDEKGNNSLSGKLKNNLPAGFSGKAQFDLQCSSTGKSLVSAQWLYNTEKVKSNTPNSVGFTIIPQASKQRTK